MASRVLCLLSLLVFVPLLASASAEPAGSRASSVDHYAAAPSWDPACYRTYEQIRTFLQGVANSYPQLATLVDAGASWEGTRRLWLIKLGPICKL